MAFRPSATLKSRTFCGLLAAQFLAAFNDQAIHASAMFFALHNGTLSEAQAVNLMPILFYSPWAVFVTLAAYLADRYSKRNSLVFWKFAEVGITAVAMLGFWLGSARHDPIGPWIVLGCVFLMGLHSAFFVPAKYGVMPEILEPQLLSRGNGWLEALSFMAIILGTVSGGLLSYWFRRREYVIGAIFLIVAGFGAAASLLIETMPAANPTRRFPPYLFQPLWQSLKTLFDVRPLRLAVIGIAFFTFIVAYMRATVYMLGLAQNPPWNEFKTSVIVGMSALGIGLGSPLAGWLSGRKIELGLVPLGGVGMIAGVLFGAAALRLLNGAPMVAALIVCIVLIGFCTSFYLVPMYTLLQHRAPKTSKGDAVATSNFFNVTGAMLASLVSISVVWAAHQTGIAPLVPDKHDVASGVLLPMTYDNHGRIAFAQVKTESGEVRSFGRLPKEENGHPAWDDVTPGAGPVVIRASSRVESATESRPAVTVSQYDLRGVNHYRIRLSSEASRPSHDMAPLPRLLLLGAGLITLGTMLVLIVILPDLPARAAWVLIHSWTTKVGAVGSHHFPPGGPVVLVANDLTWEQRGQLRSATDRYVHFAMAGDMAKTRSWLMHNGVVAMNCSDLDLLAKIEYCGPLLPVFVGRVGAEIRVSFGSPLAGDSDSATVANGIAAASSAEEDYHVH